MIHCDFYSWLEDVAKHPIPPVDKPFYFYKSFVYVELFNTETLEGYIQGSPNAQPPRLQNSQAVG